MGYDRGGILAGLVVAMAGFVCSLVGSCAVIIVVQHFFQTFEQLKAFQVLKSWIKVIISGLLGTVMLSLIHQCLKVSAEYGGNVWLVLAELAGIYALNIWMSRKFQFGTWVNVIVSCVLAFGIGNIII